MRLLVAGRAMMGHQLFDGSVLAVLVTVGGLWLAAPAAALTVDGSVLAAAV